MKKTSAKTIFILFLIWKLSTSCSYAQTIRPNGIGLRGGPYHMQAQSTHIYVSHQYQDDEVFIGGFSGWIYLYSHLKNHLYLDLTLGGIGKVEERVSFLGEEYVKVFSINPLLFGMHYEVLEEDHPGRLRPYFSAGGGPYWINEINVEQNRVYDEVIIATDLKAGGYLGGGINFPVSQRFAFNFDMKYHFINLEAENKFSGFEYGIGLHFMWGTFK